jgi:signal transduction histidine kinase
MPCPDDADDVPPPDALDQLRHDLKTPLTTIHARAQLLGRAIRRSPSLTDDEQARMLESLATIEQAVQAMVSVIDAMGRGGADGSPDAPG